MSTPSNPLLSNSALDESQLGQNAPTVPSNPPALNLSALAQPGAQSQPSFQGTQEYQGLQTATQNAAQAAQRAQEIANQPAQPAKEVPHARLLAMVTGLATGLSAFGTAIATHGKEGGVAEVSQIEQQEAQQKLAQQQASAAQKNQQIQQQLAVGDTNRLLAQSYLNLLSVPDEIESRHLQVAEQQQASETQIADFRAAHGGMSPQEFNTALEGGPNQGGQANDYFKSSARQELVASQQVLGANDPWVKNLAATIDNPNATTKDLWTATQMVTSQRQRQLQAAEDKTKQNVAQTGSVVGKLSTPDALAAPGSQAAIQGAIDNPSTSDDERLQLRRLLPQAAVAQQNAENLKMREKQLDQLISQGNPDDAGKLLAARTLTLEELKSRQVTPDFIQKAVNAAKKYDSTYNASEVAAQAKIAGSPANQQFFGNTDSLLVRGGTLDQLDAAYRALGNTPIPVVNTIANLAKAAAGSGPLAAAYAAQLGVADDYSKVMTGGVGSDKSRQEALNIINANLSPEARTAAIAQIKTQVQSQRNGRIGTNPYLKNMYPDPSGRQEVAGQAGTLPVAGVPSDLVSVQIPGSPAGRIPRSALAQFKKDHPNATVIQ